MGFDINEVVLKVCELEGYKNIHLDYLVRQKLFYENRKEAYEDYIDGGINTNISIIKITNLEDIKYIVLLMKNNNLTYKFLNEKEYEVFNDEFQNNLKYCTNIDSEIQFFQSNNPGIKVKVIKDETLEEYYYFKLSNGSKLYNLN
ncbi:hypothetical protein [Clostridium thermobutyricum]|uniref:hypothetical protein n=1 Tax=Clostridium thermobutyricum TaxID=29372 RepID=UPI0018AC38CC|nr:hypothetical protein [Clostridium thermobutyricum]